MTKKEVSIFQARTIKLTKKSRHKKTGLVILCSSIVGQYSREGIHSYESFIILYSSMVGQYSREGIHSYESFIILYSSMVGQYSSQILATNYLKWEVSGHFRHLKNFF